MRLKAGACLQRMINRVGYSESNRQLDMPSDGFLNTYFIRLTANQRTERQFIKILEIKISKTYTNFYTGV